ncbi:Polysaccharide deacetylase [Polystyrenella longa]|uniref:Polysaccharide deacetylase n=1 Tax=Polystyrenella longa TaxID=2528007 RepID=A0A518CLU7_9PLAN|nr:polysaccharide deacetylase family protein [Polystyrenella longa]QDU80195.1 Polysaccharide deacetylase [Polystyrenella longa]
MNSPLSRRLFLEQSGLALMVAGGLSAFSRPLAAAESPAKKAQIAITLDLEMSRMYPTRDEMEWDFQKGNLNDETKAYSLKAAQIASESGGLIHYFCVGRVLEQENIDWLKEIHELGHPIGNHTYDHVYVLAKKPEETQFRFQRSPWLIEGMTTEQIIRTNIRKTTLAMEQRLGFKPNGFRTPGGFYTGLEGREDIQQMLLDEGFSWVSSKYPSTKSYNPADMPKQDIFDELIATQEAAQPFVYPTGLIEIPMSPTGDVGAFRSGFWNRDAFLEYVELAVNWAIENQAVFDFLAHPSIMYVEDPNFETIKLICDLVNNSNGKAEIVSLSTIAERVQ